ncbi:LpqB family beta-propeller domain-containing protein [Kitasatospora sp. NPDC051853]|uniref:LpqB family beta-propeller domain-containing protein n=1 Tax=Kitasatospora sp. NPDC051853 TaxID=3364058 RepID=UPI0037A1871A
MRRTDRTDRRLLRAFGAALAPLMAAGCVSMPSDGSPERVGSPATAAPENLQVRVYPAPPHPGDNPEKLLTGFLDAANADEPNYATATQYLTAAAVRKWQPEAQVVVLGSQARYTVSLAGGSDRAEVQVQGSQIAEVDRHRTYKPNPDPGYKAWFKLVRETEGKNKGEWRIDDLPNGLITDQTEFKNGYRAVHRYFPTKPDDSADQARQPVLVPDPIYVRRRVDPLTAAAKALVDGPSAWLSQGVRTAFGEQVEIEGAVTVNDSNAATVKVNVADLGAEMGRCGEMAAQLFHTLSDVQGKRLVQLTLAGHKGSCQTGSETVLRAPGALAGGVFGTRQYYLDRAKGQLMQTADTDGRGTPVPGPLGEQNNPLRPSAFAVRRDGVAAAVVGADGHDLYVVDLAQGSTRGESVHRSGSTLASPSWDGWNNLWLVDPAAPSGMVMVRGRTPVPVQVGGLGSGKVQSLRISSDGTRIALVVKDGGKTALRLGLVLHTGTPARPGVEVVVDLRPVASVLSEVVSVAWADTDQLLVLGKEPDKLQQLHYFGTDGSVSADVPLQGGDSMTSVSATEARNTGSKELLPPVLATSAEQVYRLSGSQWVELAPDLKGGQFSYPG